MAKRVSTDDLATNQDLAETLGVPQPQVSNWRKRYAEGWNAFPAPVLYLNCGRTPVWSKAEVIEWARTYRGWGM